MRGGVTVASVRNDDEPTDLPKLAGAILGSTILFDEQRLKLRFTE